MLAVIFFPQFVLVCPLFEDVSPALKKRSQFARLLQRTNRDAWMGLTSLHTPRNLSPPTRNLNKSLPRVMHILGRDIVTWQVSTDHPPTNRLGDHSTLDRPDGNIRCQVPIWPLTDAPMIHALAGQVLLYLALSLLTPLLLNQRIVVIGFRVVFHER